MLLGTLGASLLENMLAGKGIFRAGYGNKKRKGTLRDDYGNKKKLIPPHSLISSSISCGYFCTGFIHFMLAGKTLIYYTSLLLLYDFEINDNAILNHFKNE